MDKKCKCDKPEMDVNDPIAIIEAAKEYVESYCEYLSQVRNAMDTILEALDNFKNQQLTLTQDQHEDETNQT